MKKLLIFLSLICTFTATFVFPLDTFAQAISYNTTSITCNTDVRYTLTGLVAGVQYFIMAHNQATGTEIALDSINGNSAAGGQFISGPNYYDPDGTCSGVGQFITSGTYQVFLRWTSGGTPQTSPPIDLVFTRSPSACTVTVSPPVSSTDPTQRVTITLTNAHPNSTYDMDANGSLAVANLHTDASGNGSGTTSAPLSLVAGSVDVRALRLPSNTMDCYTTVSVVAASTTPNSASCNSGNGINTALGCLDIVSNGGKVAINTIVSWATGVGGGIAFLLIVFSAFQMVTASGDPKRVKAAQELLTAALGGLALIILAIVLLNFIGVNVLGLGGLGFNL